MNLSPFNRKVHIPKPCKCGEDEIVARGMCARCYNFHRKRNFHKKRSGLRWWEKPVEILPDRRSHLGTDDYLPTVGV